MFAGPLSRWPRSLTDVRDHAELGRQDHLTAAVLDGLSDELFVLVRSIHLGRVEQRHAEIESAVDRPDGLGVVLACTGEGGGHAHGAEPDAADVEISQAYVLHARYPLFRQRGSPRSDE